MHLHVILAKQFTCYSKHFWNKNWLVFCGLDCQALTYMISTSGIWSKSKLNFGSQTNGWCPILCGWWVKCQNPLSSQTICTCRYAVVHQIEHDFSRAWSVQDSTESKKNHKKTLNILLHWDILSVVSKCELPHPSHTQYVIFYTIREEQVLSWQWNTFNLSDGKCENFPKQDCEHLVNRKGIHTDVRRLTNSIRSQKLGYHPHILKIVLP